MIILMRWENIRPKVLCLCLLCLCLFALGGCDKKQVTVYYPLNQLDGDYYDDSIDNGYIANDDILNRLKQFYGQWRGTRYRSGSMSHAGVDCSGFSSVTYRQVFRMELPRTTGEQAKQGVHIAKESLKAGDLVFFIIGSWQKHVGIYLENDLFMHSSTSRGVMISNLREYYWQRHYWTARRLPVRCPENIAKWW